MQKRSLWEISKLSTAVFTVMYLTLYFTKKNGDLNSTERIFVGGLTEFIKAVVCFLLGYWFEGYKTTEYMPEYIISGILSSFQSFSWIYSGQKFTSIILQILSQSKIFFVYIMATAFLKKKYTKLQSFSQCTLLLGIFVPFIANMIYKGDKLTLDVISYFDYAVAASLPFVSACSGIYFEKYVMHKVGSKWKNAVNYSITSAAVSFLGCVIAFMITNETVRFSHMNSILFISFIKSLDSLLFGYIILHYTTLMRVFITLAMGTLISIVSTIQFNEEMSISKLVSITVTVSSIALFHLPYYLQRQQA
ncbi:solute carrier family 35 (UDP-sugar transporter), member A1/2/3 [Nematocida minor]|uniref:solute carrier family 35 (UDP-sugar transporter), member A1/2/3 n=1 Tax=Nematocida minor TaxID=1912983 RepID=UPI00221ED96A|nr:solute carrier family 35 (UDP-sugar transporter), member A1/2/3 [Nematocida minor]KAI5189918.1 solute carrier family 35 (UDP-sugar transporter), member A1/2/3 [Nematocida minor]